MDPEYTERLRWSDDFTALLMRFAQTLSEIGGMNTEEALRKRQTVETSTAHRR